ncbi:hypothetical protein HU200_045371 [Digitaria exilis]|uniref:Uncharacterized protein n=1 Tax=Digitaria exilis TaxID=1010633 RepID=A0A835B6C2_9POAL|nr:hypothetical protein HU200_045371 [Digitaria exilis]
MDQLANLTLDQYLHDTTRVQFYRSYLTELKTSPATSRGLSPRQLRFGIVYVDFSTPKLERHPKASAHWI